MKTIQRDLESCLRQTYKRQFISRDEVTTQELFCTVFFICSFLILRIFQQKSDVFRKHDPKSL